MVLFLSSLSKLGTSPHPQEGGGFSFSEVGPIHNSVFDFPFFFFQFNTPPQMTLPTHNFSGSRIFVYSQISLLSCGPIDSFNRLGTYHVPGAALRNKVEGVSALWELNNVVATVHSMYKVTPRRSSANRVMGQYD